MRAGGLFGDSNRLLEGSESLIDQYGRDSAALNAAQFAESLLVNDSIAPYEGATYDKIMVNTYKALNFMALADLENARIEVNRAYERQGRAADEFAKKIQKQLDGIRTQPQSETDLARSTDNEQLRQVIQKNYSNLDAWAAYPDFVNPFTTYFHGLVKLFVGDDTGTLTDSHEFFKRTCGMVPTNGFVQDDLIFMENLLNGKVSRSSLPPTVWVIFENGLGPQKGQVRVDVPLFLVSSQISYAGIALPTLQFRPAAYPCLTVGTATQYTETQLLCSMDRIVATEFKKNMPLVVTRAILRTALKTSAEYAVQQSLKEANRSQKPNRESEQQDQQNLLEDIIPKLLPIYQAVTNNADTRVWSALPKEFQLARLPMPEDRQLSICDPQRNRLGEVTIPEGRLALVYVKIPQPGVPPAINVRAFN